MIVITPLNVHCWDFMLIAFHLVVGFPGWELLMMTKKSILTCLIPSNFSCVLQMLSSKDINFVGYTYKNFEIVNDYPVPGMGNLSLSNRWTAFLQTVLSMSDIENLIKTVVSKVSRPSTLLWRRMIRWNFCMMSYCQWMFPSFLYSRHEQNVPHQGAWVFWKCLTP